jgi:hypothetical protein
LILIYTKAIYNYFETTFKVLVPLLAPMLAQLTESLIATSNTDNLRAKNIFSFDSNTGQNTHKATQSEVRCESETHDVIPRRYSPSYRKVR